MISLGSPYVNCYNSYSVVFKYEYFRIRSEMMKFNIIIYMCYDKLFFSSLSFVSIKQHFNS